MGQQHQQLSLHPLLLLLILPPLQPLSPLRQLLRASVRGGVMLGVRLWGPRRVGVLWVPPPTLEARMQQQQQQPPSAAPGGQQKVGSVQGGQQLLPPLPLPPLPSPLTHPATAPSLGKPPGRAALGSVPCPVAWPCYPLQWPPCRRPCSCTACAWRRCA